MENLIFSLNATLPIFVMMMLGLFFRRIGFIDKAFASKLNAFVFKAALPVSLFTQLYSLDFFSVWDTRFLSYCFFATAAEIFLAWLLSRGLRNREIQGEFIQTAFRSSASLLGMAYMQNIYGYAAMGSLMILGSVPLYNIMSVVILQLTRPGEHALNREEIKSTVYKVITNPIILGIVVGFLWSVLHIPMPKIAETSVNYLSAASTPMGLISMGAMLDLKAMKDELRPAIAASFMKLFGFVALFLPFAILMGFHKDKLIAILIMLGSASTISCFIMAKNMGHRGDMTSGAVLITTRLSAFSLTFWIFLLKSFGLL